MTKEEALSELRSGNWVITKPDGPFVQNYKMRLNAHAIANHPEHYNGIPLTEDILLKCGFRLINHKIVVDVGELEMTFSKCYRHISRGNINLFINGKSGFMFTKRLEENIYCPVMTVKFVHELQNIYYWLSGKKELEITL